MKKRKSTIDEVAAKAGVSTKTVSRVFNQEPNVRPTTREKVVAAAKELNYTPNLSARRLASNRAFVIGLLYDNPADYITSIQEGCLEVCRRERFHLMIHPCRPDQDNYVDEALDMVNQSVLDGFILTQPLSEHEGLVRRLLEAGVRVVCIAQKQVSEMPCISVDDEHAARLMTEHLIRLGHRRIGFITGHPNHGSSQDRLAGYRAALEHADIPWSDELVEQGLYNFESGYGCARRLLALPLRPTAIFAGNDHMAMGVLTAAHEKKLAVPQDLSVCGFDDTPMARYAWPPLTTVRQPIKQVARVATDMLIRQVKGEEPSEPVTLHSELVLRASSAPVPMGSTIAG